MSDSRLIKDPAEMAAWSEAVRARGERLAFVPTMGYLHQGHVSLMEEGRRRCPRLAVSIFVNPLQFGPSEDLARYPRDLGGDLAKASRAGVDVAFVPDASSMYRPGSQTVIQVKDLEKDLCGASRPGHFAGVATVVCKLLNIVRPHVALFGEKDYQQLQVIRRMVLDLNLPVEIVGVPIMREPDGLAMSSRNTYLDPEQRQRAVALSRGLRQSLLLWQQGERSVPVLLAAAREIIEPAVDSIDYLELRDADLLRPVADLEKPTVMLVAAYVGRTRLIDNVRLG